MPNCLAHPRLVLGFAVVATSVLLGQSALAAQKVELQQTFGAIDATNRRLALTPAAASAAIDPAQFGNVLAPALGIGGNESLALVRESGESGIQHLHYDQLFQNIPVWGERVVVSRERSSNRVVRLGGTLTLGLDAEVSDIVPVLSAQDALEKARSAFRAAPINKGLSPRIDNPHFADEKTRLVIYAPSSNDVAKLSYEVSFFAILSTETAEPARPYFLIDAKTGETLYRYDGLTYAAGTGPGGNQKTTQYHYGPGQKYPALDVTDAGSGKCTLSNTLVSTENLNEGTADIGSPFSFNCFENTTKQINGAFSPMNDANYFGSIIFNMWKTWYGTTPISQKLILRVHYGSKFENAFWNGKAMYFGDGDTRFYPLVSLDVTSHEIAHGYTEQHSGLIYAKQSGGMNEAFSDMAGEAAEFFNNPAAAPDFLVGPVIFKQAGAALRYMCNPTADGHSIASAKNYNDGLDVHYTSGVYNKAFCVLAKTTGWDTRKAFQVFQVANRDYWTPSSNFQNGAEAVRDAAKALGYSTDDVVKAFAAVDIVIGGPALKNYLYSSLRVITKNASRGCNNSDWNCMTNLCKQDLGQTAWRGWGGCHAHSGDYICQFECGQVRQTF